VTTKAPSGCRAKFGGFVSRLQVFLFAVEKCLLMRQFVESALDVIQIVVTLCFDRSIDRLINVCGLGVKPFAPERERCCIQLFNFRS
jgi:hypothetical protein